MTIYVDEFPEGWGKWTGGGHMTCTNIFELHDMARKLGLKRRWFQNKRFPHYDLTASKRRKAIQLGAVPVDLFDKRIPPDTLLKRSDGGWIAYGKLR